MICDLEKEETRRLIIAGGNKKVRSERNKFKNLTFVPIKFVLVDWVRKKVRNARSAESKQIMSGGGEQEARGKD